MIAPKLRVRLSAWLSVLLALFTNVLAQGAATGNAQNYTVCRTVGIVDAKAPMVFADVTAQTGLAKFKHVTADLDVNYILDSPSGGLALFDYDNDGKQDVYLLNGSTMKAMRGAEAAPRAALFRNLDNFKFEDVTDKAGLTNDRWGMGVAVGDYNNDGFADLYVSNYGVSRLYKNNGNGTFTDVAEKLGIARKGWSTGASWGDYDNDGRLDVYITNFSDDSNTLYHNDGNGNFTDVTFQAEHGEPTIPFLGWGTNFLDFDNNGWQDVFIANGHVYPVVDKYQWGTSFAQQPLLFRNLANGRFECVGAAPNSGLAGAWTSRGMAKGDLDGDGKVDVVLNNFNGTPTVLRNVAESKNHWLSLKLIGDPKLKTPRDAIGSVAWVTLGRMRLRGDVISGAGYASQSDLKLHFGLGEATKVDKVEISWANGKSEIVNLNAVDRVWTITQGKGAR
jgi:hypothetical protein